MQELQQIKDKTNKNWSLRPRILVAGGDGTVAWALSILDKALLTETMVNQFWRRSELINAVNSDNHEIDEVQDNNDNDDNDNDINKSRLCAHTTISQEFYYSINSSESTTFDPLTPMTNPKSLQGITPFDQTTKSFDFKINLSDNDKANSPIIDNEEQNNETQNYQKPQNYNVV